MKSPRRHRERIVVTAGPTREKIDPVRFISNYSTGTFGYAIAEEARRRGLEVTLISGPVCLKAPKGVKLVSVESALEMRRALRKESRAARYVIMAAAVSDWRPRLIAHHKIKKGAGMRTVKLVPNPDLIAEIGRRGKGDRVVAGFALETEDLEANALKKLKEKGLDLIIANRLASGQEVFGNAPASMLMLDRLGKTRKIERKSKKMLAKIILDKVLSFNI